MAHKISKAQLAATTKYHITHKNQQRHSVAKSTAKRYVNKEDDHDELMELKKLIEDKLNGRKINMNK